ncbi:Metallothionein expression activator [Elasticomyces elasticus]|nr:Metallothionein expression activator [Elasticomyces elasticus]
MLSSTTSSVQKRRQMHRRQNSLEVPTLRATIPKRQNQSTHRRGMSLDQSTTLVSSSSGHHQLLPVTQEYGQLTEHNGRVKIDTNTGPPPQHFMQEAQKLAQAQPGFQNSLSTMFHQQLSHYPHQQPMEAYPGLLLQEPGQPQNYEPMFDAFRALQDHQDQVLQTYGHMVAKVPSPMMQPTMMPVHMPQNPTIVVPMPSTPAQYFPSPASTARRSSVEHAQIDLAPMPSGMPCGMADMPLYTIAESQADHEDSFGREAFGSDYGYESSYCSSIVDASSPGHGSSNYQTPNYMPTVYEDPAMDPSPDADYPEADILLQASAGGADQGSYYEESLMEPPLTPRTANLRNLDIDACVVETGVTVEQINACISEQDPKDSKYTCLFTDNGKLPECRKRFGRRENIRSHVQTHLGDRPYKCNPCGATFVRVHDLKRHARIHSGIKACICPCGNKFVRQDALTRHRQRGCCPYVLPGFHRKVEIKRGRPRKVRPDVDERQHKAARARQLDRSRTCLAEAAAAFRADINYASPSSAGSDHSYPVTPPQEDNFDMDTFDGFGRLESGLEAVHGAYRDTPPTSPVPHSSPAKTTRSEVIDLCEDEPTTQAGVSPTAVFSSRTSPVSHHTSPVSHHTSPASHHTPPSRNNVDKVQQANGMFDFSYPGPDSLGVDPFSPESGSSNSDYDDFVATYSHNNVSSSPSQVPLQASDEYLDFTPETFAPEPFGADALFNTALDAWMSAQ